MHLIGKSAVIIGGCGGIGAAVCRAFLKNQKLAIIDKNEDHELIKELSAEHPNAVILFLKFDITNKKSIHDTFDQICKKFKIIDIVINTAGITDETKPELVVAVNLTGVMLTTLKAIELMSKANGGQGGFIVNIASTVGLVPLFTHCAYSASKHGVVGFTRSISSKYYYQHTGIIINTFCPGKTDTGMVDMGAKNTTFDSAMKYNLRIFNYKEQTADQLATSLIKAMAQDKVGAVWMCDLGELTEVEFPVYWAPTPMRSVL